MRWDASEIAKVAQHAGFGHDDTVTATALALVTSGGLDHFDWRPGSPGSGRYVGLWGIDVDRFPWYLRRPLEVPVVAAQTAYELVRDHWGWHWSPWWTAGHWQAYVDHAGTESTKTYSGQRAAVPFTAHNADRLHLELRDALARNRARIVTYGH